MSIVTDILDATGIPYAEDGWAPLRPPSDRPCIVFHDEYEVDGPDEFCSYETHSVSIDVYDAGGADGRNARRALEEALKTANMKFEKNEPYYIYSEKRYQTIYYLEDYIVKE